MAEIEFVDVNKWVEERYKKENNGLSIEKTVSDKDLRPKQWERKVREVRGTYGENLKKRALAVREILLGTYVNEREISLHYSLDLQNYKYKQSDLQSAFEQADDEDDFKRRLEEIRSWELPDWDEKNFCFIEFHDPKEKIIQKESDNWDYPYGKRRFFDSFTYVERDLYDILLDLLVRKDKNNINSIEKAKKGEWEYFDIKERQSILELLTKIWEEDIWNISKEDFHDIQEKLIHPIEYRIKTKLELIFYWLQDNEVSGDKEKVYEDLKKVDNKLKEILNEIDEKNNTSENDCREYLRQLILKFL